MKIASIEAIPLNIPFAVGGDNAGADDADECHDPQPLLLG